MKFCEKQEKRVEEGWYFQDFTEDGLKENFDVLGGCRVQK